MASHWDPQTVTARAESLTAGRRAGSVYAGWLRLFRRLRNPRGAGSDCGSAPPFGGSWKTPRRRRAALMALGIRSRLASNTAGSGRGPWYLAKSKALSVGLSKLTSGAGNRT